MSLPGSMPRRRLRLSLPSQRFLFPVIFVVVTTIADLFLPLCDATALAPVALLTQELDIPRCAASTSGEWHNVAVFEVLSTAAACASSAKASLGL